MGLRSSMIMGFKAGIGKANSIEKTAPPAFSLTVEKLGTRMGSFIVLVAPQWRYLTGQGNGVKRENSIVNMDPLS